jgi:hypothetical protein
MNEKISYEGRRFGVRRRCNPLIPSSSPPYIGEKGAKRTAYSISRHVVKTGFNSEENAEYFSKVQ